MSDKKKYSNVHYQSYLGLEKILDAQHLRSAQLAEPAHDEMLFIITHQVYELWFKQIIHELQSVISLFDNEKIDERSVGIAVSRLERVVEIQRLLTEQIGVLETMTPLDFLDFRSYLFPASGFQSFQFRQLEALLGLESTSRITYNNKPYNESFCPHQNETMAEIEGNSLFTAIEKWLERTPFLQFQGFDFMTEYEQAVKSMIAQEEEAISSSTYLDEKAKSQRLKMLGGTNTWFASILNKDNHSKMREDGHLRMSYEASVAALLINLYRDEPILHLPFRLLSVLLSIDEHFTTWRYRHSQMVMRMLGRKIGTGGSSGHEYLKSTADKHHVFKDFYNISTLLIPRSQLPELPAEVKKNLNFYYSEK